jgi:hypothetical protein
MQKTKHLLAAAILSLVAFAGNSQAQVASPTPDPRTGTYNDPKLSIPQRLHLADAILTSGTDEPSKRYALLFMLKARPVINLLNAFPNLDSQVLADPTLSGLVIDANEIGGLYWEAVNFKVDATPVPADKITYLSPLLSSTLFTWTQVAAAKSKYSDLVVQQARAQFTAGDFAGAISTAAPVIGYHLGMWGDGAVAITLESKEALRSPDVLSWAKLVYEMHSFQHTQAGIDAVSSAFRSLDMNLVRANAFIQCQKDGQGTNPLAAVPLPQVTFIGGSPWVTALNDGVAGNNLDALKTAARLFATAPSGPQLNNATAFVAQWLRNIDGNLVRANAFVSAQSQGKPFTIAELQTAN